MLSDQKKLPEALKSYETAIALDPKFASPHHGIGIVLSDQGELEGAIAKYRQALSLPEDKLATPASTHTLAHNSLGLALQKQEQLKEAIEEFKKAMALDLDYTPVSDNLKQAVDLLKSQGELPAEIENDREWLPKNDTSLPVSRPVVFITANFLNSRAQKGDEIGTGLVIKREGNRTLIVTNRHVIYDSDSQEQSQNIRVEFFSKLPLGAAMRRSAKVLKMTDPNDSLDLAVLEITDPLPQDIKPLPISSTPIKVEMQVRAIGHPVRGIPWSIQPVTINSYNNQQLQISGAAIQSGNSGGPVINSENQLVGIVVEVDRGLAFAYPMPVIIEKLRTWGIQ